MRAFFISFIILNILSVTASEFGQYQYTNYMAISQQLQNQRIIAQKRQMMLNSNPTRNIRYPSMNNPYPNINRQRMRTVPRNYYRRY